MPRIVDPTTCAPVENWPVGDLMAVSTNATAAHYSKQWGAETGYTKFIRSAPLGASIGLARSLRSDTG
jgi:hypothetical protein